MGKRRSSAKDTSSLTSGTGVPDGAPDSEPELEAEINGAGPGSKPRTPPGLHVVATPIGNARDITLRGLETLAAADVIACEDTRVTAKLLALYGIATKTTPYHEHNTAKALPRLIKRLESGEIVALVSDAGTPLVSDPGYRLVAACIDAGLPVIAAPGASSVLAALTVAGQPTDRFFFQGFLPAKDGPRRRALGEIAQIPSTLVILESPRRLAATLSAMATVLGPRSAAIGRELTKMYEEVRRGPLDELADAYAGEPAPKGEITIVVGPPAAADEIDDEALDARLREALDGASVRDAVDRVSAETGASRRRVYDRALIVSKTAT